MLITDAADIGTAIRQRRQELGLNQQALADRVGVSRQWVVAIERGKLRAEVGLLLRTLVALDLTIDIQANARPRPSPGGLPKGRPVKPPAIDIDAIVERARRLP